MRLPKINQMSVPGAIVLSGLIIGLSVFLTTWIFFGGDNNRQKLSISSPAMNKNPQQNALTPQQIQMMQQQQQQRALLNQQASSTAPVNTVAPAPTAPAAPKVIKK
ncbi:MAG: hypothetical protein WCQ00_01900 [bacterium]